MREKLAELNERRITVSAKVEKFGTKKSFKGFPQKTVLLIDIKDQSGKILCDHLWLTEGKQIKNLGLEIGDKIAFTARVTEYEKGYKGIYDESNPIEVDYRLSFPTNFSKMTQSQNHQHLDLFSGHGNQ